MSSVDSAGWDVVRNVGFVFGSSDGINVFLYWYQNDCICTW